MAVVEQRATNGDDLWGREQRGIPAGHAGPQTPTGEGRVYRAPTRVCVRCMTYDRYSRVILKRHGEIIYM